ncbi:putative bifunctional diguanylate cyclase/phosphodiesterase [Vreelandella malpeensis]|uniref:EAL domain-containing protein n=1 Tax=Vreelandella malpeensis TaxID=1172368 RepID=A0ABS8DS02_9GAMM|nr:EAL domain-containing protein [Halomonas malpeensis]MCB8888870.1 EAL domain-containing protein [Halomonas malpeensis]
MKLARKHLLVVDDNVANVELLMDLLDDHGFDDLHGLHDPRDVVGYCQARCPDLILLDIRMPHLDGYAVMQALAAQLGEAVPPIIVLTAQIDDETRRRAQRMGVRDFITKPFQHDDVLMRIRNALALEQRYQQRHAEATTLERLAVEQAQSLDRESRTDTLTKLPNRRALTQMLRMASSDGTPTGLLFIAIDQLDEVIRFHGYAVADALMLHVSQQLYDKLGETARLGIWGGSELLVILPVVSPEQLILQAMSLLECFNQDQTLDNLLLPLGVRIGISTAAEPFEPERLVHMAALALPQKNGPVRVQSYNEELEARQRHRLHLQQSIRQAAERGEMSLVFQPKLSLSTHRVIGAEALLRWHHPTLGPVSPVEFIPLAEASGDILSIGEWVLDEAMRHIAVWREKRLLDDAFHIAVNVAARQLARHDFADKLLARLKEHGIPPYFLSLEITESGILSDMHNARAQLARLAQVNIAVAIDDFGTGHSSLAYIKTLPFSTLKIDRAFVMDLEHKEVDRHLALAITQLAHAVGCDVVAEGIETKAQADYLRSIGCEAAQGYHYARPLPADEFYDWCTRWQALPPMNNALES